MHDAVADGAVGEDGHGRRAPAGEAVKVRSHKHLDPPARVGHVHCGRRAGGGVTALVYVWELGF